MSVLLNKYGKRVIVLNPGRGRIGTNWVPPLGGASPIDPQYVAPEGYAAELAAAGYSPQVFQKMQSGKLVASVWSFLKLVLVALVITMFVLMLDKK